MKPSYLFSTLAVMASGAFSDELTGVMFTFKSGPDKDGDTHTIGTGDYTPLHKEEGNMVMEDWPYYCTWKTAGDPPLYHYNWSTADDKIFSKHPIYGEPHIASVQKGACVDDSYQLPPDMAWPKKS